MRMASVFGAVTVPAARVRDGSNPCSCAVALADRRSDAYNEEAFRYLLALERKRAERSGRAFLVVLVDLEDGPGSLCLHRSLAPRLFSSLWRCLRESDVVGWYREHHVVGALLTELSDECETEMGRLESRISGALRGVLPSDAAHRLQVRVYRHCELLAGEL